jgi:hypothetical protein
MWRTALFTLILIINNGGGDGKTTWSEALTALARLAGLRTAVLDVDPGLRGYSRRNGAVSAERLEWDGEFDNGRDLPGWLEEAMSQDIAVVDTGANLLAAQKEVSVRLSEIAAYVQDRGGRLVIHAVTSPNKPGSDEIVKELHDLYSQQMEFAIIKNNRDDSSQFGPAIGPLPAPKVEVPFISPGLQAYRLRRPLPLEVIIQQPEDGFSKASALLADHLRQIARNVHVRSLFSDRADTRLAELTAKVGLVRGTKARTLSDVSDVTISAEEAHATVYLAFRNADPADTDAFLKAARDYQAGIKELLAA